MAEYIERGRLLHSLKDQWHRLQKKEIYHLDIDELIERQPTADVVEVVRCKDCKHSIVNEFHQNKPLICCLTKMCGTVDPNWYCAGGEKALKGGEQG